MVRVVGFAFGIAVLASIVSGGNQAIVAVAFFGALVVLVVPLVSGQTVLRCPFCRKRVKLGAAVCHHCGRAVAKAS